MKTTRLPNTPQRLKEMKAMQRDPQASDKARRAERRLDERGGGGLISIRPVRLDGSSATSPAAAATAAAPAPATTPTQPARTGGGFKKGGFKSAFGGGGEVQGAKGRLRGRMWTTMGTRIWVTSAMIPGGRRGVPARVV